MTKETLRLASVFVYGLVFGILIGAIADQYLPALFG
jgi:hypothetical protein